MLRRPLSYVKAKNLPDKEREARFKLNQLRNAAQQTPTLHSGCEHILTPSSRLHEESATESLKLKGLASLAERSRQGSRYGEVY